MTKSNDIPDPSEHPGPQSAEHGADQALQHSLTAQVPSSPLLGNQWGALPEDSGVQSGGANPRAYLHAVRRRWLLAGFLGAIGAAVALTTVWVTKKPTYTATAMLRISTRQESLVFDIDDSGSRGNFDVYKSTQQQLIKSDFVLIAALRKPEVSNLAVIQAHSDPVRYLAKELRVDFPGEAELMTVKLSGNSAQDVTNLVNAVVEAYLFEVVDRERSNRQTRMKDLDDLYTGKSEEVRSKRIQLKDMADQLGTSDSAALALQQQIALEQYATFRRESVRAQFEARRIQGELKVQQASLEKLDELEKTGEDGIEESDIEFALRTDPFSVELKTRQSWNEMQIAEHQRRSVAPSSSDLDKLEKEQERLKEQLDDRKAILRKEFQHKRRRDLESRIAELTTQLALATEQVQQLGTDLEESQTKAEQFGGSSIDVEIMRSDISRLEKDILGPVAEERDRLRVELETPSRVQLFQEARRPSAPDDDSFWAKLFMAAMLGIGLPLAGILFLDVRKQRVNSPADVARDLGIKVLGTMPPFRPARLGFGLRQRSGRRQERVREAVNGIIARLLHEIRHGQSRVVLVTSATSGEGKTTLSTQLATALAHIGYRTLLIDFDLRRPSLARLFGAEATPGVSELLRGETKVKATFQETDIDGLTLMPAGAWRSQSFAVLANGSTRTLFDEVRRHFDFVIVDGSPVLPVAESRLIAQYADRVILSVLRDVSRGPQVMTAWETLTAFGAGSVEAVVTGFCEDVYYERLEPRIEMDAAPSSKKSEVQVG